jgi:hypothetical protein
MFEHSVPGSLAREIGRKAIPAALAVLLALAGCSDPSEATDGNIQKGVELALAEQDPLCMLGLFDDELPTSLKSKYPSGGDGFPLHFIGGSLAELERKAVSQMANTSGPDGGKVFVRDWVKDGVLDVKTSRETVQEGNQGRQVMVATASPTSRMEGWTRTRANGTPVVCHGRSKVVAIDNFTVPVDSRRGKVTRVRYRWAIDEVAPWMIDGGYEEVLRADVPDKGVQADITLVATNKGWMPMLR